MRHSAAKYLGWALVVTVLLGSIAAAEESLWTSALGTAGYLDEEEADAEEEDEGNQVEIYMEELFFGFIVYPQEQDEMQLTWGFFDGVETNDDSVFLFEVEYGITDRLQIGVEMPREFIPDESYEGVRNLGVEIYYNWYSDRQTGRAYGGGIEFGVPLDSTEEEPRVYIFEPFFVAYQDFREFAVNFSAALEIEEPVDQVEPTETSGELALAGFRRVGRFVPILEWDVEISADAAPVRFAPGLYWHPCDKTVDFAVSFPIGLNDDAPDFGVFCMAIVEFDANLRRR